MKSNLNNDCRWYILCIYLIAIFLGFPSIVNSQDQAVADSLQQIFDDGNFVASEKLILLKKIAENNNDPDKKINASTLLITSSPQDSAVYLVTGYLNLGHGYRLKGDMTDALSAFFKAIEIVNENNLGQNQIGILNIAIADVYSLREDQKKASKYYTDGIEIFRQSNDSIKLASALLNAGDEFYTRNVLDTALMFFTESGQLFSALNFDIGQAYNLGNMGLVLAKMGNYLTAERNIGQAVTILEELEDYYPVCVYLNHLSDIYIDQGKRDKAIEYANKSLNLAESHALKQEVSDAHLRLSNLYERSGQIEKAFDHYKRHVDYRDSINNLASVRELASVQADYEVSQKQME